MFAGADDFHIEQVRFGPPSAGAPCIFQSASGGEPKTYIIAIDHDACSARRTDMPPNKHRSKMDDIRNDSAQTHAPSGIATMPFLVWGSHIGQLFDSATDLREMLVPYFRAGLLNNERCLWVTDGAFGVEDARAALREAVPDLDDRERRGQIEISDKSAFYDPAQPLRPRRLVEGLVEREREALAAGYRGVRTNGNCAWVKSAQWNSFLEYETGVQEAVQGRRLICMCSYQHDLIDEPQVNDVVQRHHLLLQSPSARPSVADRPVDQPIGMTDGDPDPTRLIALLNEDLAASRALHDLSLHMLVEQEPSALYGRIVEAARQLLGSDFASLQMLSGATGETLQLELIAHCGFTLTAATHWRKVFIDSTTSCGVALATGKRVIIDDVETCDLLVDTTDLLVFRETGIRAMQTTPLRARDGELIGMLSTHWGHAYEPNDRQLQLLDILAREAAGLIARMRDEARLRESEARLQHMDRMKEQFLATLAHELRNPLAPIRNGLQILRQNQTSAGAGAVFEMLDRQIEHMVRLVDDLMEVARINTGTIQLRRQPIDVTTVLEAAIELSRTAVESAGHALKVDLPSDGFTVDGDEVRLAQVFSNLINNAAKYTPAGGRIDIAMVRTGSCVEIGISDTGVGFSPEEQSLLFVPFSRLQPAAHGDGLGVGLALAKKLVELHGGSISANSDGRDKGSCFTVSLPVQEAARRHASAGRDAGLDDFAGLRVAVVDDNHDAADSLGELLRVIGCDAAVYYDGARALDALEKSAPAVAFIDLGMPGMDGYELARRFRAGAAANSVQLVALTGWGQPEDRARSAQAGFDLHLTKPISMSRLNEVLRGSGAM
ncbi:MEDS domain-containing protein [Caballeronia sp. LZ029]|uniref:MEDS domain-containing protein n=1 Tax=Caballeronia sp. LZ029 TaxID=3038564 RepID=UPI002866FB5F|nr:MEDS domain-containing protein [Caballeronia sp. LZ029]MDR5744603.1 MEDS domain-containing protein [Caballeronia sp. LZ029]